MTLPDAVTKSSRRTFIVLLFAFGGLMVISTVQLILDLPNRLSSTGGLLLSAGSAALVISHLDRDSHRKRVWIVCAVPLIALSLVLAIVAVARLAWPT